MLPLRTQVRRTKTVRKKDAWAQIVRIDFFAFPKTRVRFDVARIRKSRRHILSVKSSRRARADAGIAFEIPIGEIVQALTSPAAKIRHFILFVSRAAQKVAPRNPKRIRRIDVVQDFTAFDFRTKRRALFDGERIKWNVIGRIREERFQTRSERCVGFFGKTGNHIDRQRVQPFFFKKRKCAVHIARAAPSPHAAKRSVAERLNAARNTRYARSGRRIEEAFRYVGRVRFHRHFKRRLSGHF